MAWRLHRTLCKPIRLIIFPCAGKAGMSWLYLSNPCAFLLPIAHGAAGAVGARLFPAPLLRRGATNLRQLRRKRAARMPSAVVARLDQATQYSRGRSD